MRVYCFALDREAQPFLKRFPTARRIKKAPCLVWEIGGGTRDESLVLITGVGSQATLSALEWTSQFQPTSFTIAGFCGALTPKSKVAEVLHFREVIDESATVYSFGEVGERLLTTSRMIAEPVEKKQLAEKYGSVAVDMESATAVKWCKEHGIPVRVIRAVSDEVDTKLSPRLVEMLSGGKPSIVKVLGQLVRSPKLLPELLRLARYTRRAATALSEELADSSNFKSHSSGPAASINRH